MIEVMAVVVAGRTCCIQSVPQSVRNAVLSCKEIDQRAKQVGVFGWVKKDFALVAYCEPFNVADHVLVSSHKVTVHLDHNHEAGHAYFKARSQRSETTSCSPLLDMAAETRRVALQLDVVWCCEVLMKLDTKRRDCKLVTYGVVGVLRDLLCLSSVLLSRMHIPKAT